MGQGLELTCSKMVYEAVEDAIYLSEPQLALNASALRPLRAFCAARALRAFEAKPESVDRKQDYTGRSRSEATSLEFRL